MASVTDCTGLDSTAFRMSFVSNIFRVLLAGCAQGRARQRRREIGRRVRVWRTQTTCPFE